MSSVVIRLSPLRWIPGLMVYFIFGIIAFIILRNELLKRKQSHVTFTTTWFKLLSITCIISCFLYEICGVIMFIPGFCVFSGYFISISFNIVVLAMGFYQLHRLYYCFANEKVHSDKGYSKWIFVIMIIIGVLIGVYSSIAILFVQYPGGHRVLNGKCAYNDKYEFEIYPFNYHLFGIKLSSLSYHAVRGCAFMIWDLCTLALYMVKIWGFKKYETEEPIVYKRIMSILHKIFILTIFYEVINVMNVIGNVFLRNPLHLLCLYQLFILSVCYSMYLMMDYNQKQYTKFLKMVYFLKLHWIFCCYWRYIIAEQLNELNEDKQQIANSIIMNKQNNNNDDNDSCKFETRDVSIEQTMIKMPELSIATCIHS